MRVTWDNRKLISYHVKISILIGPLSPPPPPPPPPPKAGKIKALLMGLREKGNRAHVAEPRVGFELGGANSIKCKSESIHNYVAARLFGHNPKFIDSKTFGPQNKQLGGTCTSNVQAPLASLCSSKTHKN